MFELCIKTIRNSQYQLICFIFPFFLLIAIFYCKQSFAEDLLVGNFSKTEMNQKFPKNWEELFFNGIDAHTIYSLENENNKTVIKADSNKSSSGLIRKISIDPKEYPVINWNWKISNVYKKGNVNTKEGDDYPARIYVTFAYDPEKASFMTRTQFNLAKMIYGEYPPVAAINYIWASSAQKGDMTPNPYTERTMMIVVESGAVKTGQWLSYTRNLVDDYKRAFGEQPPLISAIAIMTDSDNTEESATAWYGDISLTKKKGN